MAINTITNFATITYDGETINSNSVDTILELNPTIVKSVDFTTAKIDDVLTYTIVIDNPNATEMTNMEFSDLIPDGAEYVLDSFEVDGSKQEPLVEDNTLKYTILSVDREDFVTITFQVTVVGA